MGIINIIKRWNVQIKERLNKPFYKLAVLFGTIKSPSFELAFKDVARFAYTGTTLIIRANVQSKR